MLGLLAKSDGSCAALNFELQFSPLGDNGILLRVDSEISPVLNKWISDFMYKLDKTFITGFIEAIPAYNSVLILYNPLLAGYNDMLEKLEGAAQNTDIISAPEAQLVHIPVLYGGNTGVDLQYVAGFNDLTIDQVIKIHSGRDYLVYMLGFSPGFPYLGGMSEKISAPRLDTPRTKIAAGSVGIAGNQTGIYPQDSPGGWRIIGRTPLRLFDLSRDNPFLLKAGQYIRFVPVDPEEYHAISDKILKGTFTVKTGRPTGGDVPDEKY